ncbi:unnamed protein product [Arabidopsis thaliana]|uniref:Uncharacterized protein n=1 Tax=Arabidopsis thaliana TaxID=3702 RepID=A0A5S9Y8V5_ARATH|nr:unnamed protein product [Arabidopsis thaliana]
MVLTRTWQSEWRTTEENFALKASEKAALIARHSASRGEDTNSHTAEKGEEDSGSCFFKIQLRPADFDSFLHAASVNMVILFSEAFLAGTSTRCSWMAPITGTGLT